jgi:hypothetical protein
MSIQLQTSYIPKGPTMLAPSPVGRGRSVSLFGVIAVAAFLAAVALAGAVFFYHRYLVRTVTGMDSELAEVKRSFEPEFVDVAARLNRRIESAKALLSAHRSLSPLFDLLEKKTLASVRFQNFAFDAKREDELSFVMTGQAKSFNAVALQSDIFGEERYFRNPVFSNFTLNDRGDVIFQFKAEIDEALLRYSESLAALPARSGANATTTLYDFE